MRRVQYLLLAFAGLLMMTTMSYARVPSAHHAVAAVPAVSVHHVKKQEAKKTAQKAQQHIVRHAFDNYVMLAPYTGKPTYNSKVGLVVNTPGINTDYNLLYRRLLEDKALMDAHQPLPTHPRLVLSGGGEGQLVYNHPYIGNQSTDINLTSAMLDAFAEVTPWVSAYMSVSYDDSAITGMPRRESNSNLYLDKGFVILGNLRESPIYASAGQMYVPFGRFSTSMISDSLTKDLGATKTRALVLGYAPTKDITPTARIFAFSAPSTTSASGTQRFKDYGADLGFRMLYPDYSLRAGMSYISNIADANSMQNNGGSANGYAFRGFNGSNLEKLHHRVPGAAAYLMLGYRPLTLTIDALSDLRNFDKRDVSYNGHGAKIQAANAELAYAFQLMDKPTVLAVGYGRTRQAMAFNLPRQRYNASITYTMMRNVLLKLEYQHNINYPKGNNAMAQGLSAYNAAQLGKTDDTVTMQMGVYF